MATIGEIVIAAAAVVTAGAAAVTTIQIAKVSDLASAVQATSSRIDQIYPTLVQQSGDIGSIKGSLEVAASKLTDAAVQLEAGAKAQAAQADRLASLTTTVERLTTAIETDR